MDESVPVPLSRLEHRYDQVAPAQAEEVRELRRSRSRARWGEGALLAVVMALGIALLMVVPTIRVQPVFIYLDSQGLQQTATAISDLPPDTHVAAIEAVLWTYVRSCEHYVSSEADYSYGVCSALASEPVRRKYQEFANPKLNKDAPAALVGARGFIRVYRRTGAWGRDHEPDYSAGVYRVTFCKVTSIESKGTAGQMMSATVAYQLVSKVPLWERVTFNSVGLMVVQYSSEPVSAVKAVSVGSLGSDNPCG